MEKAQSILRELKGVGPKACEHFDKLGIRSLSDLLFHLPSRYEDRTRITPIDSLQHGDRRLIEGEIVNVNTGSGRQTPFICQIVGDSGTINLCFFHHYPSQRQRLSQLGVTIRCFGEVRQNYKGGLDMMHPEYSFATDENQLELTDHLTPVYPTTKGLSQAVLRKAIQQVLDKLSDSGLLTDILPQEIREQYDLPDLSAALCYVHQPPNNANQGLLLQGKHRMQQRLAFEELVAHQLGLQKLRLQTRQQSALSLPGTTDYREPFLSSLPFTLTAAQQRVIQDIAADLARPQPMMRLLQGDVGSGKTVVAAVAALQVIEEGCQVALMAPTELLAEQHYHNFKTWFEPLGLAVGWLSGKQQSRARKDSLQAMAAGEVQIVIGTHALFQQGVTFARLALLIVDEQHRFGVHQRLALREKGIAANCYPHQLIMTATPIPRTLAMMAYADLDRSVIDELPPGRKPVTTVLISNARRSDVVERVKANCLDNKQVYWVCTLIEESEALQCQAAEATAEELQRILPAIKIGLVHGRMKSAEKNQIMVNFKSGALNLLVATTVIEVGVDVPNASLMIIENPERLGLAQLHQLRGRIGRGDIKSHCVLLFQNPLSATGKERLRMMKESQDGFKIAECDLKMRGPGEVLGTRQAGELRFRIANLLRDQSLLEKVGEVGKILVKKHPHLVSILISRWITDAQQYASV